MDILFLTIDEALAIHESRLEKYGGSSGIRELDYLNQLSLCLKVVSRDNICMKIFF